MPVRSHQSSTGAESPDRPTPPAGTPTPPALPPELPPALRPVAPGSSCPRCGSNDRSVLLPTLYRATTPLDVITAAGVGVLLWSGHVPAHVPPAPEVIPSEPVPPPALPGAERRRSLRYGAVQLALCVVGVGVLAGLAAFGGAGLGVAAGVVVCALLGPALCLLGIWLTLGLDDRWERRHPQCRDWLDALAQWQAARYCGRCDAVYWDDRRVALAPREARRLLALPDPEKRW